MKFQAVPLVIWTTLQILGVGCGLSAPRHQGPQSDHFDGERFFDQKPARMGPADVGRWLSTRKSAPWPTWMDEAPAPPPEPAVGGRRLRITVVNHATTLVQMAGLNILTDPIWAERASPFSFAGPKRVRAPGVRFEDLPPIDVVVLSHNHYDHTDVETLQRLVAAHDPLILCGLGGERFLALRGIEAQPLDWWQERRVHGVTITSVPNQHFSSRFLDDDDGTLWSAWVFHEPDVGGVYFAGDTGYGAHFKEVGARFPGLRLAILPIGAYEPTWFMGGVHTTPAEAVQAQKDLGARTAVGMHWGTFPLADEGYSDPLIDLAAALRDDPDRRPFWVLDFGHGKDVP